MFIAAGAMIAAVLFGALAVFPAAQVPAARSLDEKALREYAGVYQWGPLDETMDKIMATPGLRMIFNLAYAPAWWQAIDATGKYVWNPTN